ncbi:MAG: hypothetical protein MR966_12910 [Lachnospiraceae bacterium]|nr:hypothetical protein [Lachnospiraceae bacterium]
MKNPWFTVFLTGSALVLMLLFPGITLKGAGSGLLLWYQRFLPAVFPFMILSGLLTGYLKKGGAVFAVTAGFLNGYPIGAKTAADLKKKGLLPENTACYYAVFCNMSSPMFMAAYAGLKKEMPVIYLTSAALLTIFCQLGCRSGSGKNSIRKRKRHSTCGLKMDMDSILSAAPAGSPPHNEPGTGDYLLECTGIMVKAGIYIMYFSILAEFLSGLSFEGPVLKLLVPFLELTTGISRIQAADFPFPWLTRYLKIFLCVSGGLCTAFQSREVTYDLNLSLPRYLLLKLIQASAVCAVCFLVQP